MIFSLFSRKNVLTIFLYSLLFGEEEYLLRFSCFNTFYLLFHALSHKYFGQLATLPIQFLGLGVAGTFIFLIPEPIIRLYSYMVFIVGTIIRKISAEFSQIDQEACTNC